MMAMPSVSKNLKGICEEYILNFTATVRTVSPHKREHLRSVVSYDYSVTMGNTCLD
jgi:hypothetical protein